MGNKENNLDSQKLYMLKPKAAITEIKLDLLSSFNLNKGINSLKASNIAEKSEDALKKIIAQNANDLQALNQLGYIYLNNRQYSKAEKLFKQSLALEPNQVRTQHNLSSVYLNTKRYQEAIETCKDLILSNPNFVETLNNLAVGLSYTNQYDQALIFLQHARQLKPEYPQTYFNLAYAYNGLKQYDLAKKNYQQAIDVEPNNHNFLLNMAFLSLKLGDFEAGWNLYENRLLMPEANDKVRTFELNVSTNKCSNNPRKITKLIWHGKESLLNKKILLTSEQGLGDFIQFCRYVFELEKLGAQIILEVPAPLLTLAKSLSPKFTYIAQGLELPDFDYTCPLLSLPLAFNTRIDTIPAPIAYLKAPTSKVKYWHNQFASLKDLKVGIVWSGSTLHKNDTNRSAPLHYFATLFDKAATFHSLQKDYRPTDRALLNILKQNSKIHFHHDSMPDYSDTAAIIANLDLIITVDTSVAHLAGAMGKKVWILLPYVSDFRWLVDRKDSPWYPTARLFAQPQFQDWHSVFNALSTALDEEISLKKSQVN